MTTPTQTDPEPRAKAIIASRVLLVLAIIEALALSSYYLAAAVAGFWVGALVAQDDTYKHADWSRREARRRWS